MPQDPTSKSRSAGGAGPIAAVILTIPDQAIERVVHELAGTADKIRPALAGAINKTLAFARTRITNELAARVTAKRVNIFRRTSIDHASAKNLSGRVVIQGRRIALVNFQHAFSRGRNGGGVSVTMFQGGPAIELRHAFVGVGVNENQQVFERRYLGGTHQVKDPHYARNRGRQMQQLRAIYGISLRRLFNEDPELARKLAVELDARWPIEFESQIKRFKPEG